MGNTIGQGESLVTVYLIDEMEAFDSLPKELRAALREHNFDVCALEALNYYNQYPFALNEILEMYKKDALDGLHS